MALPTRFPRYQGPKTKDLRGPYSGANQAPQTVTGYREGFNKTPSGVIESLYDGPAIPQTIGDVQQVTQIRDQQADAGNTLGMLAANGILSVWGQPQPRIGTHQATPPTIGPSANTASPPTRFPKSLGEQHKPAGPQRYDSSTNKPINAGRFDGLMGSDRLLKDVGVDPVSHVDAPAFSGPAYDPKQMDAMYRRGRNQQTLNPQLKTPQPARPPAPAQQAQPQQINPPGTHYGDWMRSQRLGGAGGGSSLVPRAVTSQPATAAATPNLIGTGVVPHIPPAAGVGQLKAPGDYSVIDQAMGVDKIIDSLGNGYAPRSHSLPVADQILGTEAMIDAYGNRQNQNQQPPALTQRTSTPSPVQPQPQTQTSQAIPANSPLPPSGASLPQRFAPNQRYPLPMQMPDGGARSVADAINSGAPVPRQSGADPAVWGPGGRQYPAVTPTAEGGGQQPLSVTPRYGQSGQQAAQSLTDARQQARDFTNQGVDRIFATNGGTVNRGIGAMTGLPNPSVPASAMQGATSMPYGSGSTIIRTADGRTIAAGNASAMNLLEIAKANGGNIPQGQFNKTMQLSMDSSAKHPSNMKRRSEVADMRSDARDRQIVTNAMRFGVRNPLAIQTAKKMGVRLPGMPRMSGDAMAGGAMTTQAKIDTLSNAKKNPVYADIEGGFDPGAANGDKWARHIASPNWEKIPPADIPRVQRELKAAMDMTNFKASDDDRELLDAFVSGGPTAVAKLKKKRVAGYKAPAPSTGMELMY